MCTEQVLNVTNAAKRRVWVSRHEYNVDIETVKEPSSGRLNTSSGIGLKSLAVQEIYLKRSADFPYVGWLYACRQDESDQKSMSDNSTEVLPVISDNDNYFESQAEVAKSIGMSRSVIQRMRTGQYSYEQIEILLAQRRHVLDVIRQAESVAKKCNYQVCHACRPAFQDRVEKFAIF